MAERFSAAPFVPASCDLSRLREAAAGCRGCPLYANATQTVFGEGAADATVMLVGEKPGDQEDRRGAPFVGPAGRLLDKALTAAGIDRGAVYVTNAVKHFKWTPQGGRRLHKRPSEREVAACRPWLEAEAAAVRPAVLVCLGATAAHAAFGRPVRLRDLRGAVHASALAQRTVVTVHPSALLRLPDTEVRHAAFAELVADLRLAAATAAG
jgi:uracil-DNA glycosylase family protein